MGSGPSATLGPRTASLHVPNRRSTVSLGTAFFGREQALNKKLAWGEWSGYFSAPVYADFHDIEYNAIREAAGVIDITPLYKYEVSGPDAVRLLDRVMTRDMTKLRIDRIFYSPWCDEEGKVLDDGTITRLAEDRFRITAADPCYRWFVLNATGLDVEVADVSDATAALTPPAFMFCSDRSWTEDRGSRCVPQYSGGVTA